MIAASEAVQEPLRTSPLKRFVLGRRWVLLIPLTIITVIASTAVLAEWVTP